MTGPLPRCTVVLFNYCCCVEFWWHWFVPLHRSFPFIAFCLQHELVNRKSLPLVKKQPFKIDVQTLNVLYEMTVAELEMIALSSYDVKIGFLKTNSGRVYFQVFHPAAFHIMDKAKRTSRIMHGVFLFLAVYNTIFAFLYSFKIMKDWINHEECTVVCEDSYAVEDINLRQALWWM